ncbi:MAG TPA: NAD(P)/FAD-dependent oxidoreductase [Thermoanaerobaculia bacterium]|nr:NAD(P)/FAD-dependent oxidoreductase [Thermoanaerobaculia bacterium]
MRTPRDTPEITLVGAGLAGSLLAIFLARRGYRVTLLERRLDPRKKMPTAAPASAGRSINLALANRGISALEEVGVMESLWPALIPMAGRMLHDEEGRLRLIPYGNKPHEVIYSVSRAGLNTLLLNAAESTGRVSIRFGETVCGVDFADRRVRFLADGDPERQTQATLYDVLIGTDGSASAVRAAILERTGGRLDEEPLGHGYKELTIPAANEGGGQFRMEKNALHIWPRGEYMLIALPNADGSFTATLFLPNQGEESFQALTTPEAVDALFERRFADTIPLMPRLGEDFFGNPTGHLETIRCEPWSFEDHALVLGDAAHAIVPFHGQGMNAAFEDCSAIDRCLRDPDRLWNEVFAEFERRRRPNTDAIADMALENYIEMRSTVREPKFQLKKDLSFRLEERHPRRFIPRYSMVMFHTIPYAEAKRRGAIQEEILDELTSRAASLDQVDLARADRLIAERLGTT